jgi:hypothetical protein
MTVLIGGIRSRSIRSRSKRSTKRRSTKKQRGGNLTPLQPLAISGYETPVITQHLPPGAISYDSAPANIEGGKRSRSKRSRSKRSRSRRRSKRSSKKSRSRKSRSSKKHKQSAKGAWGISPYLARMAHPRSAVGGRKKY